MKMFLHCFFLILVMSLSTISADENSENFPETNPSVEVMNNARLHELLKRIDPQLEGQLGFWTIKYENLRAQVITDENADRMRVIVPIVKVEDVEEGELIRLMQANIDSALDARYCVANGIIWSAFIHQLSILSDEELLSGLAQALTAATSFGSTYSSGALIFRGGDSEEEQRKYYESIVEKGLVI